MVTARSSATVVASGAHLAHDIKTPRTALRQALRAVAGKLQADEERIVTEFSEELGRLENLLRGVLRYVRPLCPDSSSTAVGVVIVWRASSALAMQATGLAEIVIDFNDNAEQHVGQCVATLIFRGRQNGAYLRGRSGATAQEQQHPFTARQFGAWQIRGNLDTALLHVQSVSDVKCAVAHNLGLHSSRVHSPQQMVVAVLGGRHLESRRT